MQKTDCGIIFLFIKVATHDFRNNSYIICVYSYTSRSLHFQAVSVLCFLVHCCPCILFFSLAFSGTYEEIDSKNVMYKKFTLGMVFPVTKEKFIEIVCYIIKINNDYIWRDTYKALDDSDKLLESPSELCCFTLWNHNESLTLNQQSLRPLSNIPIHLSCSWRLKLVSLSLIFHQDRVLRNKLINLSPNQQQ